MNLEIMKIAHKQSYVILFFFVPLSSKTGNKIRVIERKLLSFVIKKFLTILCPFCTLRISFKIPTHTAPNPKLLSVNASLGEA